MSRGREKLRRPAISEALARMDVGFTSRSDPFRALENFFDVSDPCATAAVATGQQHEDPTMELRLAVSGMVDMQVEPLGDDPRYPEGAVLAIGVRQRADGELQLLARSLRWLADRIEDPSVWPGHGESPGRPYTPEELDELGLDGGGELDDATSESGWSIPLLNAASLRWLALAARRSLSEVCNTVGDPPAEVTAAAETYRRSMLELKCGQRSQELELAVHETLIQVHGLLAAFEAKSALSDQTEPAIQALFRVARAMTAICADTQAGLVLGLKDYQADVDCLTAMDGHAHWPPDIHQAAADAIAWCCHVIARAPAISVPEEGLTLALVAAQMGSVPFAAYRQDECGYPVIVTGFGEGGRAQGFPTLFFHPSLHFSDRPAWIRDLTLPQADQNIWTGAPVAQETLDQALADFYKEILPAVLELRAVQERYVGPKKAAEMLGVTVPRLTAWLRASGYLERQTARAPWLPRADLAADTVQLEVNPFSVVPTFRWAVSFIETLRPRVAEISATVPVTKATEPPSGKQVAFITQLLEGTQNPPPMPATRKKAQYLIESLLAERQTASPGAAAAFRIRRRSGHGRRVSRD